MLESNELGTVSEFNVFLATMRWVDADKSREQFLDEILGLVRFPTMDYEELGLVGKHPTAAGAAILKVGFRAWECINYVNLPQGCLVISIFAFCRGLRSAIRLGFCISWG